MSNESRDTFTLENIDFIFRHPLIVLCAFLIIFNICQTYAATIPPQYRSFATLSFETPPGKTSGRNAINEKKGAAEEILSGFDINAILRSTADATAAGKGSGTLEAPSPKRTSAKHGGKIVRETKAGKETIRDTVSGMEFLWEVTETSDLLTIDFTYSDPNVCYQSVKAVMDMITKESAQKISLGMESNISFLRDQLKLYGEKLSMVEKEMDAIKDVLIRKYPELSAEDKELIASSSDDISNIIKRAMKKFEFYEEAGNKLRRDLVDLQKRREQMLRSIESGTFMIQTSGEAADAGQEDVFLGEYSKAIAAREIEIATLSARGYKNDHPGIQQLQDEIKQFKNMRKRRLNQLSGGVIGAKEYDDAKKEMEAAIEELDLQIAFIKDRIEVSDQAQKAGAQQLRSPSTEGENIKAKMLKLSSLKTERELALQYYMDIKKQLADAELKYRGDKEAVGSRIVVTHEPFIPTKPDFSKRIKAMVIGFIIALFASIGLAYGVDKLLDPVSYTSDIRALIGVPVAGTISRITTPKEISLKHRRLKYLAIWIVVAIIVSRLLVTFLFSGRS